MNRFILEGFWVFFFFSLLKQNATSDCVWQFVYVSLENNCICDQGQSRKGHIIIFSSYLENLMSYLN